MNNKIILSLALLLSAPLLQSATNYDTFVKAVVAYQQSPNQATMQRVKDAYDRAIAPTSNVGKTERNKLQALRQTVGNILSSRSDLVQPLLDYIAGIRGVPAETQEQIERQQREAEQQRQQLEREAQEAQRKRAQEQAQERAEKEKREREVKQRIDQVEQQIQQEAKKVQEEQQQAKQEQAEIQEVIKKIAEENVAKEKAQEEQLKHMDLSNYMNFKSTEADALLIDARTLAQKVGMDVGPLGTAIKNFKKYEPSKSIALEQAKQAIDKEFAKLTAIYDALRVKVESKENIINDTLESINSLSKQLDYQIKPDFEANYGIASDAFVDAWASAVNQYNREIDEFSKSYYRREVDPVKLGQKAKSILNNAETEINKLREIKEKLVHAATYIKDLETAFTQIVGQPRETIDENLFEIKPGLGSFFTSTFKTAILTPFDNAIKRINDPVRSIKEMEDAKNTTIATLKNKITNYQKAQPKLPPPLEPIAPPSEHVEPLKPIVVTLREVLQRAIDSNNVGQLETAIKQYDDERNPTIRRSALQQYTAAQNKLRELKGHTTTPVGPEVKYSHNSEADYKKAIDEALGNFEKAEAQKLLHEYEELQKSKGKPVDQTYVSATQAGIDAL